MQEYVRLWVNKMTENTLEAVIYYNFLMEFQKFEANIIKLFDVSYHNADNSVKMRILYYCGIMKDICFFDFAEYKLKEEFTSIAKKVQKITDSAAISQLSPIQKMRIADNEKESFPLLAFDLMEPEGVVTKESKTVSAVSIKIIQTRNMLAHDMENLSKLGKLHDYCIDILNKTSEQLAATCVNWLDGADIKNIIYKNNDDRSLKLRYYFEMYLVIEYVNKKVLELKNTEGKM